MTDRTPESVWDDIDTDLPQPGEVEDEHLGVEGPAEPLPDGDADNEEEL